MKLIIADAHVSFRNSLAQSLSRIQAYWQIELGSSIADIEVLLNDGFKPDIIILDAALPGMRDMAALMHLVKRYPACYFAVIMSLGEPSAFSNILNNGARGLFFKTIAVEEIARGIGEIYKGRTYFPEGVTGNLQMPEPNKMPGFTNELGDIHGDWLTLKENGLLGSKSNPNNLGACGQLTKREAEVGRYLIQGASNKIIANHLGLKEVTIKLHVRSILRKLGVRNRTQAALMLHEVNL